MLVVTGTFAFAGTSPTVAQIDSRRVARALALRPFDTVHFQGGLQIGKKGSTDVKWSWFNGTLKDGLITQLTIDGQSILDSGQTLDYFPIPEENNYVNIGFEGYGKKEFVSYGSYWSQNGIKNGDNIAVEMWPANVDVFVPYALPAGVDGSGVGVFIDGYNYSSYNSSFQGFFLSVDPSRVVRYEIRLLTTLAKIAEGKIDIFAKDGGSQSAAAAFINMGSCLGIQNVDMTAGYLSLQSQQMACWTELPSEYTGVCKVYKVEKITNDLVVTIRGVKGKVIIEYPTEKGEMVRLEDVPSENRDGRSYIEFQTSGYDKLIITVLGTVQEADGFYVYFGNGKGG